MTRTLRDMRAVRRFVSDFCRLQSIPIPRVRYVRGVEGAFAHFDLGDAAILIHVLPIPAAHVGHELAHYCHEAARLFRDLSESLISRDGKLLARIVASRRRSRR